MVVPLLELDNISFYAGPASKSAILSGFSLEVGFGEVHALLGRNGTGKSTVACLVMGCEGYRPSEGDIMFAGSVINNLGISDRAKLGISMAWQEPVRFEGISVGDYLRIGRKSFEAPAVLELVGLSPADYLHRMVDKSLSGGERKRIELASVLALQPRLAVLDEPDSGIDMLSIRDVINVISAFRQSGTAVLLITHREEISMIADRASQLCNGRIVCSGSALKVAEHYKAKNCAVCSGIGCHYV